MFRRRSRARADELAGAAAARLDRLARQWRPGPPADDPALAAPAAGGSAWDRILASAQVTVDGVPVASPQPKAARLAFGPWSASALRGLAVLVLVATALVGWWWWSGRPVAVAVAPTVVATGSLPGPPAASPPATALEPSPTPTPTPVVAPELVVHVAGYVVRPGLVRVPVGARVADAIAAAGGVTRRRAAQSVNLARPVADGEQIVVSLAAPVAIASAGSAGSAAGTPMAPGAAAAPGVVVDLNTASLAQLEELPGVGPVLAGRIAQWRAANGPFRSVDELGEVSGIGQATLSELRPLARV